MTTQSSTEVSQIDIGQANLELAEALREVATWLEMHAGDLPLPRSFGAYIMRGIYGGDAREVMTAVAQALGDRATEKVTGTEVVIGGKFGPVEVSVTTDARSLGAEFSPPQPEYEPILPVKANGQPVACTPEVTPGEDEAFAERGWRESES